MKSLISSLKTFQFFLLFFNVVEACLSISTSPAEINPAFSKPKAKPPAPAKSSRTLYLHIIIIYPIFCTLHHS